MPEVAEGGGGGGGVVGGSPDNRPKGETSRECVTRSLSSISELLTGFGG